MSTETVENDRLLSVALQPTQRWTPGAKLLAFGLMCVVMTAAGAFIQQYRKGLGLTGLGWPMYWGIYIINFVFFIGISHAGTLISAILRVTGANWRAPLTRMAEAITVFALMTGPLNVIFDLGRPDRMLNIIRYPHFTSPLLWDVCCITTYFIASITYLYLPLIPDLAILRDRYPRRRMYRWLSLGWTDTPSQQRVLKKIISIMAIVVIPIAVSVHTVVSFVFAMTVQPMWHSSIFGPYFVIGAIYSGIATLFIAMAIIRRVYHLEEYLTPKHFLNLGYLLTALSALWLYFTFDEYLTTFYGGEPHEMRVFLTKFSGQFAGVFWVMVLSSVAAFLTLTLPLIPGRRVPVRRRSPAFALRAAVAAAGVVVSFVLGRSELRPTLSIDTRPGVAAHVPAVGWHLLCVACLVALVVSLMPMLRERTVMRMVIASVFVNIGMWLERYVIVVPTLSHPRLPLGVTIYHPSSVELLLMAGCIAWFSLLFLVFSRYFPMLPVWEMQQEALSEARASEPQAASPVALVPRSPAGTIR